MDSQDYEPRRVQSVEWGYRVGDDTYVVAMSQEKYVRQIARNDPGVVIVRRFISDWEVVDA